MTPYHPGLSAGRWFELTLVEQLANVGSEIERALNWASKGNLESSSRALERGLELLDLTLADPRHRHRLKEPARVREVLLDYFCGDNHYSSSDESLRRYFRQFALAAAIRRERAAEAQLPLVPPAKIPKDPLKPLRGSARGEGLTEHLLAERQRDREREDPPDGGRRRY